MHVGFLDAEFLGYLFIGGVVFQFIKIVHFKDLERDLFSILLEAVSYCIDGALTHLNGPRSIEGFARICGVRIGDHFLESVCVRIEVDDLDGDISEAQLNRKSWLMKLDTVSLGSSGDLEIAISPKDDPRFRFYTITGRIVQAAN